MTTALGIPKLTAWRVGAWVVFTAVNIGAVVGTIAFAAGRISAKFDSVATTVEALDGRVRDLETHYAWRNK